MTRNLLAGSPSVVVVDLDAVRDNTRHIRALVGPDCRLYAALKCDAYGLGLVPVARAILDSGADGISVARAGDAFALREGGVEAPILLYPSEVMDHALVAFLEEHRVTPAIGDAESLVSLSRCARHPVPSFLKVDVGLRRLGVAPEAVPDLARLVKTLPRLRLEGVLTHLHVPPDPVPRDYLDWQFARFCRCIDELVDAGHEVPVRMAASSTVLRLTQRMTLTAVDPGRLFFGLVEDGHLIDARDWRQPLAAFKTEVIAIKDVAADDFSEYAQIPVGGGVRIGVIPLGTSDGMLRASGDHVLIHGRPAPLFPAVSLEHSRVDLSRHPDACLGDEVVIIGRQDEAEITLDDVADYRGVSPMAVSVGIAPSVRRLHT